MRVLTASALAVLVAASVHAETPPPLAALLEPSEPSAQAETPADPLPNPLYNLIVANQPVEVTGVVDASVAGRIDVNVVNTPEVVPIVTWEPFQTHLEGSYGSGDDSWLGASDPVPVGKRWVVEFLSLRYGVITTDFSSVEGCNILISGNECDVSVGEGVLMRHHIPTTASQDTRIDNGLVLGAALPVKIYVEQGQRMCVSCPLPEDNNLASTGRLNVSGILEPVY